MVLDTLQGSLPYAFAVLIVLWVVTAVLLLLGRYRYERTDGKAYRAIAALSSTDDLRSTFSRIPRRTLERIAADAHTPERVAMALSEWVIDRWGAEPYVEQAKEIGSRRQRYRRIAALRILFYAGYDEIVTLLETALASDDRDVVGTAVALLGRTPEEKAGRLLIAELKKNRYSASRIATYLDHFSLPLGEALVPLLTDRSPLTRFWGVTLLSRYEKVSEVEALAGDPDERVRKAVAESLGTMAARSASGTLERLLSDTSWIVRAHAVRALGDLGAPGSARSIAALLTDEEWWVRLAARESLVAMGDAVVPIASQYLNHGDRFARNGAAEVLQNLGVLDRLLDNIEAERGSESDRQQLVAILRAGGTEIARSLVLRRGPRAAAVLHALHVAVPEAV